MKGASQVSILGDLGTIRRLRDMRDICSHAID